MFFNRLLTIYIFSLGVAIAAKINFAIVSAIFDYNPKVSSAMKPEYWEKCMPAVEELLKLLTDNAEDLTTSDSITDEAEVFAEKPYKVSHQLNVILPVNLSKDDP